MKCQCDKRIIFCLLLYLSSQAFSQVDGDLNNNPVDEAEARFLFINMLEFLGEFETKAREWISPDILGNEAFADLDGSTGNDRVNSRGGSAVMSTTGNEDE
jgi:hypothetical protein